MRFDLSRALALAAATALPCSLALAQNANFAAPVRLLAGEEFLGADRLFPSPACHDMNGDGLPDIVVGDLRGRLTVALRNPGDGAPTYAAETRLRAADGKDIDFHNW